MQMSCQSMKCNDLIGWWPGVSNIKLLVSLRCRRMVKGWMDDFFGSP